jgi:hypothetical protein
VTRNIPAIIKEAGFRVERLETRYLARFRFPKSGRIISGASPARNDNIRRSGASNWRTLDHSGKSP